MPEPRDGLLSRPLATVLAVAAGLYRTFPALAIPNVAPVGAFGLYSGARLPAWQAFALPLAVMALSDVVLKYTLGWPGFDPWVYASFLVYVLFGRLFLRRTESPWRIGAVTVAASVQFFLVTNFAVWLSGSVDPAQLGGRAVRLEVIFDGGLHPTAYARNLPGLLACYELALPFYRNTLLGDLIFSGGLFGLHAVLSRLVFRAERVAPTAEVRA